MMMMMLMMMMFVFQASITEDITQSKVSLTSQGSSEDADRISLGNLSRTDIVLSASPLPEGAEGDAGDDSRASPSKFASVTLTEAQQKAITGAWRSEKLL